MALSDLVFAALAVKYDAIAAPTAIIAQIAPIQSVTFFIFTS
jgi:hypothetical protein